MESKELIIHLDWEGPHNLQSVETFNGPTDYGLYQIYGGHPVYGGSTLLYIGLAGIGEQTFSQRLRDRDICHLNRDAGRVEIYLGRLGGSVTPDSSTWVQHIRLAERLLIYAHRPIENIQRNLASLEPDLHHVHVLNWWKRRDLFPEVSGARFSMRLDDIPGYHSYTTQDYFPPPTTESHIDPSL